MKQTHEHNTRSQSQSSSGRDSTSPSPNLDTPTPNSPVSGSPTPQGSPRATRHSPNDLESPNLLPFSPPAITEEELANALLVNSPSTRSQPIEPNNPLAQALPPNSPLARILLTWEHLLLYNPKKSRFSTLEKLALAYNIDKTLHSVPHSIITYYKHLLTAATYERVNKDIPYEVQYTAVQGNSDNPYNAQAAAYGIDKLLDEPDSFSQLPLPLINHPNFLTTTYLTIQSELNLSDGQMAVSFLATLLQTHLRAEPLLTNLEEKRGPKIQTYAASLTNRLPQQRKPRRIVNIRPMRPTKFPCSKCIAAATILTTTEKKYTDQLTIRPRNKTLDEYEQSLPNPLRKKFREIYLALTQGIPNHQESMGCPLHAHPEKRQIFSQAAPNKLTESQRNTLHTSVLTACKVHHLCGRCGRIRTPKTERYHQRCSPQLRNCPGQRTPECLDNTCTHSMHTTASLWRSEEITLNMKTYLLEYHTFNPFY